MTVAPLSAHALHDPARSWSETSCYLDVWIEVLHELGHDPVPVCAPVLASRWDVDQWTFLKPDPADLRALYGLEVAELNPWDDLTSHVVDHLAAGDLVVVEVDAFWLPDTAGTSYRTEHTKTSIAPLSLDLVAGRMRYAHGSGVHEATGEDVTQLWRPGGLLPYVELVRVGPPPPPDAVHAIGREVARRHLRSRSGGDEVRAMGRHLQRVVPRLRDGAFFHAYAFATWRQLGAAAEVAADLSGWLDPAAPGADDFRAVSDGVKSLQFSLARLSRGRAVDVDGAVEQVAAAWEDGLVALARALDR